MFVSVPDVKAKGAGFSRLSSKINWDKDRDNEPERYKKIPHGSGAGMRGQPTSPAAPNSKANISATAITRSPESSELGSHRNE
jgi:hypothetical protein